MQWRITPSANPPYELCHLNPHHAIGAADVDQLIPQTNVIPQSDRKLGLLRINNEVTFVTHTSATDVFDPEDHNR